MHFVGATAYQLIKLCHLFTDTEKNIMKILKRIIIEKPPRIEDKLCSNELKELVMKLLSKKR
jgi:hypothetical protein